MLPDDERLRPAFDAIGAHGLPHPDRVLFGTDAYPPDAASYRLAFRFCETDDEAFGYAPGCGGDSGEVPPQGRWDIGAAGLPAALLPGFYAGNARRSLDLG